MCGITGIFAFNENGKKHLSATESSIATLSQRGPDGNGIYNHKNVSLGHSRLAIIDVSSAGAQPMTDETGRYVIVYNGEFYNYREHRKNLIREGIHFKSDSDTEVLLHLYIKEGPKCLEKVNGFFAFAIYDKKENSIFIARDRIGIKPLVIYQDEDKLIFASEMKALFAYGIEKEIDKISLFTYLQLNYCPGPFSMLKGISKLEPGNYIKIENGVVSNPIQYYKIPYSQEQTEKIELSTYDQAKKSLKNKLDQAVIDRLVSDVPLGTFLSGGIDSSIITSIAAKHVPNLNSFSIGFKDEPFFDETHYAKKVAKMAKTNHTVFELSNNDLYENLHDVLNYLDEPFADSSAIAVNILCKKTKENISVALSGDGADEMFSGYNKHQAEFRVRNPGVAEHLAMRLNPIFNKIPQSRNSKLANLSRQMAKFSKGAKLGNKLRYWSWASIMNEEGANFLMKEPEIIKSQRLSDEAFAYKKRKDLLLTHITKGGSINDVLYTDMHLVLSNDMLKKVDSMSMANSLEVRTPFLDHNLVDFAFSLPSEFKINSKTRKKILTDSYRKYLPEDLIGRPKQGFEVPLLSWFQQDLRSTIENDLINIDFIKEQGIFNYNATEKLKQKLFSNNPGDSPSTIWAIVVFQHWWKKYLSN